MENDIEGVAQDLEDEPICHQLIDGRVLEIEDVKCSQLARLRSIQHIFKAGSVIEVYVRGACYHLTITTPATEPKFKNFDAEFVVLVQDLKIYFSTDHYPRVYRAGELVKSLKSNYWGGNCTGVKHDSRRLYYISQNASLVSVLLSDIELPGDIRFETLFSGGVKDFVLNPGNAPPTALLSSGRLVRGDKSVDLSVKAAVKKWEWQILVNLPIGYLLYGHKLATRRSYFVSYADDLTEASELFLPKESSSRVTSLPDESDKSVRPAEPRLEHPGLHPTARRGRRAPVQQSQEPTLAARARPLDHPPRPRREHPSSDHNAHPRSLLHRRHRVYKTRVAETP